MTIRPKTLDLINSVDSLFRFDIVIGEIESHYPAHRHDFLECTYVLDGTGIETINGVAHLLEPGTFTFLLPYQVHDLQVTSGQPLRLYSCGFERSVLEGSVPDILDISSLIQDTDVHPPFHHFVGEESTQIMNIFHQLYIERHSPQRWRPLMIHAKLLEALITFDRARMHSDHTANHIGVNNQKMWEVVAFVHRHFRDDITLTKLADTFHISPPYLSSMFKRHTGQTFIGFLRGIRIQYASSLLMTSDVSVTEIALEVGFNTYSSFSRSFREMKGVGPAEYRKQRESASII